MKIKKRCMCGATTDIEVKEDAYAKWQSGTAIQRVMPDMHFMYRECLISGMCLDCQEKMFNTPAPGHEELFGKHLGNCSCCDRAVYEKDIKDNTFICTACGSDEYEES